MVGNSKDTLRGISQIINPQNVKRNMNYEEIEKNLTRNGLIVEDKDPQELFESRLNELAKSLNVSLGTPTVSAKNNTERRSVAFSSKIDNKYNTFSNTANNSHNSNNLNRSVAQSSKSYIGSSIGPRKNMSNSAILLNSGIKYGSATRSPLPNDDDESSGSGDDQQEDNDQNDAGEQSGSEYSNESHSDREDESDHNGSEHTNGQEYPRGSNSNENSARKRDFPNFDYSIKPNSSSEFGRRTQEERIHNQVREVINDMGGDNGIISLENARKEDEKICMLEEIDSLKQGLEEEGAQGLDKIPRVSEDSSYEMVENVLKRLRLKNDRSRYTSLADEFILWGASALEDLFDGKRSWFGKKPDLTGWSKEVQVKLRRMHHDTSTLISGIMHDFNIGPATRVVLELVPNCVMYARRKKINHGKPDIFESEDISNSINNIRNFD